MGPMGKQESKESQVPRHQSLQPSPLFTSSPLHPRPDTPEINRVTPLGLCLGSSLVWVAILPCPGSLLPIHLNSSGDASSGCPLPACPSSLAELIPHWLEAWEGRTPPPPYPQVPAPSLAQAWEGREGEGGWLRSLHDSSWAGREHTTKLKLLYQVGEGGGGRV